MMQPRPRLQTSDQVFERVCTQVESHRKAGLFPLSQADQDALAEAVSAAITDNRPLITAKLANGATLVTLADTSSPLPKILPRTLERLATVCEIIRDRRGVVHIMSPNGNQTIPTRLLGVADIIAERAKGSHRSKVEDDFTWIAETSSSPLYRKEAETVLAWLNQEGSNV